MTMLTSDFGRYLQKVEERDVDLLLMEEFHVVPAFASWFAEHVGLGQEVQFDGAWHSLNEQDGESDLLLRVRLGNERVAVLIENKIGAPDQDRQDERYHVRGIRSQEAGRFERFVTCMCAPQVRLGGLSADTAYEHRVPYEWIYDWFSRQDGPRAGWRAAVMREAIEQGRRGYTMQMHAGKTAFHLAYWEHLRSHHPTLVMKHPGVKKGPGSDWMIMKGVDFPKGVTLDHKNTEGCIDLSFVRTHVAQLAMLPRPDGARVLKRGKSAALSLSVPLLDMDRPFEQQIEKVEAALLAAHKLAPFAVMLPNPV